MDKYKVSLTRLSNNAHSNQIVADIMAKDVKHKYFAKDCIDDSYIDYSELAEIYLIFSYIYVIEYDDNKVGILSFNNDSSIEIYVDPEYQHMGIGSSALRLFENIAKEEFEKEFIKAEIRKDDIISSKLLNSAGYEKTGEEREIPVNQHYITAIKYKRQINNSK